MAIELIEMLIVEYCWDMKKALDELYGSEIFAKLNNPECGLYYESAVYGFLIPEK